MVVYFVNSNKPIIFAAKLKIFFDMCNRLKEKLAEGRCLDVKDLSPEEKRGLFSLLCLRGASEGFAYDRFFKEGFAQWELLGVDHVKREFMAEHLPLLLTIPQENIHTLQKEAVREAIIETAGGFWALINQVFGLQSQFVTRMAELGMGRSTVLNRFAADDWKIFQRQGILRVWDDYCESHG